MTEVGWWAALDGDDLDVNTAGVPPYDAARVALRLTERLKFARRGLVIDLGCGTGRLTAQFLAVNPDLIMLGVDTSPRMRLRSELAVPGHPIRERIPYWMRFAVGAYSVLLFQHLPHSECVDYVTDVYRALDSESRFVFQYVEGDAEGFCNHQADELTVRGWCEGAGFDVIDVTGDEVFDEWRWVTAVKP